MVATFAALDALVSGAVDATAGERLRFTPKSKGDNWGKTADADRPVVECAATFLDGHTKTTFVDGDRRMSDFNARASNQTAFASVDRSRFAAGKEPRAGDLVETIDQNPVRRFEIVDVYPDGYSRWAFPLVPK